MLKLIFLKAIEEYKNNLKVMLSFGILFLFLILFVYFEQFFLSTGTVLFNYDFNIFSIIAFLFSLAFLYAFSFFVSLTVYSVKRDVQKTVFDKYWNDLLKKASIKIFLFYVALALISFIVFELGFIFSNLLIPMIFVFVIFSLLMYVPQSIVLDEKSIFESIIESIKFWILNFKISIAIVLFASLVVFILSFIEWGLEFFAIPGFIITFILTFIFLVPFMEQTKSYAFVLKFNLIKQPEVLAAMHKPKPRIKINATRLREKIKGGKI